MQLGKTQTLKNRRKIPLGLFLESQTGERAFLPKIFADENAEIGDEISVFRVSR